MRTTSIRTVQRVIALTLTTLFTLVFATSASAVIVDPGGDHGVCDDGLWQKADWNTTTASWDWEDGPDWDGDAPGTPILTVTVTDEDGDPVLVEWTASTDVLSTSVKASTEHAGFSGGSFGIVTGIGGHAISHIVFCYGPEPPPAPTGSLTVAKEVVGDYEGDDFDFAGTCQLPQFPAHAQFSLADGESWTFPERIPGYLDGSACQFAETAANGADGVTYHLGETELTPDVDGKVHVALSSTEDLVLTVTNTFEPEPPQVSSIALEKTPDVQTVTYAPDDGDEETVTYTYLVTNTGETTLTGLVLVDDVLGTIPLTDTELDPGASTTGTATHVVTAADAAAGQIVNQAEVTGVAPDETQVTANDDATVLVEQVLPEVVAAPEIDLEKTALVEVDDGRKVVVWSESAPTGTRITYEYVITNTGKTALTGITLVDDVLGTITLDDTDLAVGASMTVTATHVVTAADADVGSITNEAVVTATDPEGTEVEADATETVFITTVRDEVIDREVQPEVIDRDEVQPEVIERAEVEPGAIDRGEELPVTGAPAMAMALAGLLSLATGAGLLRTSRRQE